jgi:hypothetical protein
MTWKKILWNDDVVIVRKNSGANIGTRPRLNFVEGSNITLAISDDAVGDEIDISIAATQYSHPSAPPCRAATAAQTGHATATQITKLDGIATGADVTGSNPPQSHGADKHTDITRTFFVGAHYYTTGGQHQLGVALDPATDEKVAYRFQLPADFVSLTSVQVCWSNAVWNTVDRNWVLDADVKIGVPPSTWNQHGGTDNGNVVARPAYENYWMDYFTIDSGCFTSIDKNDICTVILNRDANNGSDTFTEDIMILGLKVTYVANM